MPTVSAQPRAARATQAVAIASTRFPWSDRRESSRPKTTRRCGLPHWSLPARPAAGGGSPCRSSGRLAGAFDRLTCVTGTNGFSGFGSVDADLSLAAGFCRPLLAIFRLGRVGAVSPPRLLGRHGRRLYGDRLGLPWWRSGTWRWGWRTTRGFFRPGWRRRRLFFARSCRTNHLPDHGITHRVEPDRERDQRQPEYCGRGPGHIFPLRSISTRVYVKTIHHHDGAARKMTLSNSEAA